MSSISKKTFFPKKSHFRFALRRSNWVGLLPVVSCGGCQEAVHEALSAPEMVARGIRKITNAVLVDNLVVAGEFDTKELEVTWERMKQPKKVLLVGNCVLKTVKSLSLDEDLVTLKGCPPDQKELKTFLII